MTNRKFEFIAEEQRLIAMIGRIASASSNLDTVFAEFAELSRKLIPFDRLAISTVDPETGMISDAHISGLQTSEVNVTGPYTLADSALPPAVYEQHQVVVSSADQLAKQATADVVEDNRVRIGAGLRSAMFAPLVLQGNLVGTLVFRSKQENPYSEREVELAKQISTQIAGVISVNQQFSLLEKASLAREKLAFEQSLIAEMGRIASSSLDFNEVLSHFGDKAQQLIPHDRLVITTWSDDGLELVDQHVDGVQIDGHGAGNVMTVPKDEIWHRLFNEKMPWLVNGADYVPFKERNDLERERYAAGLRAMLIVPIIWQGATPGSISFRSIYPDAFNEHEVELAVAIAAQISGAVVTSKQYRQLEDESLTRERIAEIGRIVSSSLDLNEVYPAFAEHARALIPYDRLVIGTLSADKSAVVDQFVDGLEIEGSGVGSHHAATGPIYTKLFVEKQHVALSYSDYEDYKDTRSDEQDRHAQGLRSFLMVPLIWQGSAVGALGFRSKDPDAFGERETQLALQIASQIAGAVVTSIQYSELELESQARKILADEQAGIAEIGRIASSTLDIQSVLTSFVEQAKLLVPFDRIVVTTVNDEMTEIVDRLVDGIKVGGDTTGEIFTFIDNSLQVAVLQNQTYFVANGADYEHHAAVNPIEKLRREAGLRSLLMVPMVWQGRTVGSINLRSFLPDAYNQHEIRLAEQIAAQIAGAIATSNQYLMLESAFSDIQSQATALEAADDAIIVRSADTTVTYVNSGFERQTGFSREEIVGTDFKYPEHVDLPPDNLEPVWAQLREGKSWRKVVSSTRKDGTEYIVDATLSPVFNEHGEIDKFVGVRRDVTAQVRADEEIRSQAAALEAADHAITIRNLDGSLEYVNEAFEKQTGYTREEVVTGNPNYVPTIELSDSVYQKMWAHVHSGKTWNAIVNSVHKDGTEYVVDASLSPIFNESGEIEKFVGVRRDVTAQVRADEAIRSQAAALEASDDAVMILDADQSLVWVNEAFVRDTGYSREEAIGRRPPFLRSEKEDPNTFGDLWNTVKSGKSWHKRMWVKRKDGAEYMADTSVTPVLDNDGNIAQYVGVRRDATELIQAEQDRESRRAIDARNQQLLELNTQREEFFSTVSHELRTPLTSVMAFADIMSRDRDGTLTGRQQEHLDVIKRNSRNLNELVEDMLDFSRMSTDQLRLEKTEFEIHSLLDSVIESLEPTANQRSQKLVIEPHTEPVWIKADHGRIVQVVSNLITNSCKYSQPSTRITVKVSAGSGRVVLSVADQGVGIPPEDLDSIYSPFFRSNQLEVREEIGTGLGLAISKTLVDLHDGDISAKSEINKGTEITVTLPGASPTPTVNAKA